MKGLRLPSPRISGRKKEQDADDRASTPRSLTPRSDRASTPRGDMERTLTRNESRSIEYAPAFATEAPEEVGAIVTRPARVGRDGKARIAASDVGIGTLHSMYLAHRGEYLALGGQGQLAVVVVSTLSTGQPKISRAKLANGAGNVSVSCSAAGDVITAFGTGSKVLGLYGRACNHLKDIELAGDVKCAMVSPDGSKVAVGEGKGGGHEARITLYTVSSKSVVFQFEIKKYVFSYPTVIEFSNHGKWLAFGGDMRKAAVWDITKKTQQPLGVITRGGYINCLDFSKSNTYLAIGSSGDQLLTVVDTDTWAVKKEVLQASDVHHATFSFDEEALAVQAADKLFVIGRDSLEMLAEITPEESGPKAMKPRGEWTPDGKMLLVKGRTQVHAYDYKTRRDVLLEEQEVPGSSAGVTALALSPYGRKLAVATPRGLLFIALGGGGTIEHTRTLDGAVSTLSWCPDNSVIAVAHGNTLLTLSNMTGYPQRSKHTAGGTISPKDGLRWSKDGAMLACVAGDKVLVLKAADLSVASEAKRGASLIFSLSSIGLVTSMQFGSAAFGNVDKLSTACSPTLVTLGAKRVQSIAVAHDGTLVAAGGNGKLAIIDVKTLEAVHTQNNRGWVMGLAFSPDDQTLAIGSHDKSVSVLHVQSGLIVARCGERSYWPLKLAFSADGSTLADANRALAVYSCDGSKVPLVEAMDAAPMLRVRQPVGGPDSDFTEERVEIVSEMVAKNPRIALNIMPEGERDLQPMGAATSGARLLDVLASRTERPIIEALLERLPVLAVLPWVTKPGRTPFAADAPVTFDVAIRLRDVRTIRLLLLAAAKAPVPLRGAVATTLIPKIVEKRMGGAVTAFLQQIDLEPSGADIRSGCNKNGAPLTQDEIVELHPTWGGAGTLIWLNYDPNLRKLAKMQESRRGQRDDDESKDERTKSPREAVSYGRLYELVQRAGGALPAEPRRWFEANVLGAMPVPDAEGGLPRSGERVGVEVKPYRVRLDGLSSKRALFALGEIDQHGTFDNESMAATVNALWHQYFFPHHLVQTLIQLAHVAAFIVYCVYIVHGKRVHNFFAAADEGPKEPVPFWMVTSALVLLGGGAYIGLYEVRQILGTQLNFGFVPGTLQYLFSMWNLSDVLSGLAPVIAVLIDASGVPLDEGHVNVRGILAFASIALFVRVAQLMRGFELTGWLVMVLLQNVRDMVGFLLVMFVIFLFFSVSFMMLFTLKQDEYEDEQYEGGDYSSLGEALLASFQAGALGDVDLDTFENRMMNPRLARGLFIVFMVSVGVVALNALIAFLGDSYAKVQERQVEATLSLKASLIVEYYNAAGPLAHLRERGVKWTHVLKVVKDEESANKGWKGQLNEIKDEVHVENARTRQALQRDMASVKQEVQALREMLQALGKHSRLDLNSAATPADDGASTNRSKKQGDGDGNETEDEV